ncbi:hypothetical protein BU14_1817s0002 [Porphyra umbilicalis]|uniref:Uncharacterized protein n=1 Tax=Porphyra umbilicalis TaxID=2786 RepID=A0A1X6NLC4_PORUM|nr:hypothetical protein BU14_1817s0002 [Porphyra umbilicalis]|eukprot:OSX69133.1 hypothetical protein BU14_1817s0002 [Porphyra umbilicalis]
MWPAPRRLRRWTKTPPTLRAHPPPRRGGRHGRRCRRCRRRHGAADAGGTPGRARAASRPPARACGGWTTPTGESPRGVPAPRLPVCSTGGWRRRARATLPPTGGRWRAAVGALAGAHRPAAVPHTPTVGAFEGGAAATRGVGGRTSVAATRVPNGASAAGATPRERGVH